MTRGNELLESIVGRLREHADVKAVWLAGSRGRGASDEYSDIDIWMAIDDEKVDDVVADPLRWIHTIVPTVMHAVVPGNGPVGGTFVGSWVPVDDAFEQVDWYIAPYTGATRAAETTMVFGDVPVALPVEASRLPADVVCNMVRDNLVLALLRVSNSVRYARRGQTWRAADHARRADKCLANAGWILDTGTAPGYEAGRATFLTEPVHHGGPGVRMSARTLLGATETIAARANLTSVVQAPVAAMHTVITEWENAPFVPHDEYYRSLPRRRLGAGVLITDTENRVLVLETTYKQHWEIPGGACEQGEQPRETARREVREELGLNLQVGRLLVFDHRSEPEPKGDAIMLVYEGGILSQSSQIRVDGEEIASSRFVSPEDLERFTTARMATRLRVALQARHRNRTIEIENGDVMSG